MAVTSSTEGIIFPTLFARYDHTRMVPIRTDSAEFACLTSIARLGLVTLEGARGREALERVGRFVLDQWRQTGRMDCDADPGRMREYVDHFLERVRGGFPSVVVDSSLENPHTLPITSRVFTTEPCEGAWDGDRANYVPGTAVTIAINAERFGRMVALSQRFRYQKAEEADDSTAFQDFITFQFILGARMALDLCHGFVGLLAGSSRRNDFTYPRPKVDSKGNEAHTLQEVLLGGEPGRYLQQILYGGYLEIYEDSCLGRAQPGIPFIINRVNLASTVSDAAIAGQIWSTGEDGQFPLGTHGRAISVKVEWNDKVLKMVYDNHHSSTPRIRGLESTSEILMRALIVHRDGAAFRVAESDMCWVATQPGRLVKATRVR
ncbi:hypothetical protein RB595_000400 [Gaeumannomyces hyphopodioides]